MTGKSQKKKKPQAVASERKRASGSRQQEAIADWLQQVKFKRSFIGGVREEDVWMKISELNSLYEKALEAERIRCDTLIEHYRQKTVTSVMAKDSEEGFGTEKETGSRTEHSGIILMGKTQ